MAKKLTSNVYVGDLAGGTWYGPDYPENEATADVLAQITNPAAYEEAVDEGPDLRFRNDDFGDEAPPLRAQAEASVAAAEDEQVEPEDKPARRSSASK
jgi:hypothetical protein